jgi:DNA-binding transcriptional LysR family regulator
MPVRPFDLNLRHLRALVATVEHGSVSAAALAVALSQPALTQGLAKLERQLAVTLLERHSAGVRPSPAGTVMAGRVTAALRQLAAASREAARSTRGFARPETLMTATQVRAFLALAEQGSFVAAAAAEGLSQPALHRAVRDLEQVCGVPLVERRGRGVGLTPPGRRIARGIRLAAREIEAGIVEVTGNRGGGRIVIGAMPMSRALVLPHAIAASVRQDHRAEIVVVEGSWRDLMEPLRDGVIDLTVGSLREQAPPDLEQRALFVDDVAIVGRGDHPLVADPAPGLDALARYGWIVGQEGTPLRAAWNALFAGRTPPFAPIECGSVMVIRGVLLDTDLLTLLSPDQVAIELRTGTLAIVGAATPRVRRTIGITTRRDWHPTQAQARFLSLLRNAVEYARLPEIQYRSGFSD